MKKFVLCNSDTLAIPVILKLKEMKVLAGLGITKKAESLLRPQLMALKLDVPLLTLTRENWVLQLRDRLKRRDVDSVWVLTFPWKIPNELLEIPEKGILNFHFGLLPKYKGADPIFWQFKKQEGEGGVTVQVMNKFLDGGPIIFQEKNPIIPGETYGFYCQRLGQFTAGILEKILTIQKHKRYQYLNPDIPEGETEITTKPTEKDFIISFQTQSANQIEWLVNATNPKYGGAVATIGEYRLNILEVTPVTMETEITVAPGTIVHADIVYGLVVACADRNCLRITISRMGSYGYVSGIKLFNMGFREGHRFD